MKNAFVAFLDILGFKELDSEQVKEVLHHIVDVSNDATNKNSLQCLFVSDSIFLWVEDNNATVDWANFPLFRSLLFGVQQIQVQAGSLGIWIRGGLAYGPLVHETRENAVFLHGQGVIDAFLAEKKAEFPRVVLSSSLFNGLPPICRGELVDSTNKRSYNISGKSLLFDWRVPTNEKVSEDCVGFVDYLAASELGEINQIIDKLTAAAKASDGAVLKKYLWLKTYLRSHLSNRKDCNAALRANWLDKIAAI